MAIFSNNVTIANDGELIGGGIDWQSVKTSSFTAVAGEGYFVNTTSAAITVTLPASPSAGDTVAIKDYAGTFATNNLTIARNGNNIQGGANNSEITTNRASVVLVYIDATKGWLYTNESNVADLQVTAYVTATGGTITTSGDYKIHTFTGDGCFVVSCGGNSVGSDTVDYLVVAGGGGGGVSSTNSGGGGGAGGYRESHSTPVSGCYTASPLATPTGITVSATTYPITVGAGGAAQPTGNAGAPGSNSVFSTITSTGGGGGGAQGTPQFNGLPGGSGGGGSYNSPGASVGGTGNTPPVSPPQGNPGGPTAPDGVLAAGGGGGGAGAAGQSDDQSSTSPAGSGGNGVSSSITGSSVTRAGGGGGASLEGPPGSGGSGGGGTGSPSPQVNGTANTGGGAGGFATNAGGSSGAGGKGIVIIRYKFQ